MSAAFLFSDIIIAYVIDLLVGDPYWLPHPVRLIGWLIGNYEKLLRKMISGRASGDSIKREGTGVPVISEKWSTERKERLAGGVLMLSVTATTFLGVFLLLRLAEVLSPVVFHIVNIYFIYSSLATRCLAYEAKKVHTVLIGGDLSEARKRLSMLVGRQTEHLNGKEVAKAVIETTAENTVDGIISPLFYAVLGSFFGLGAPLAYAFKATSTLDSMVGYMNEKYINFGRVSAKTDDAANYLPARLSGVFIPLSALLCGLNMQKSFSIMLRDRRKHKSPNCAYPEAAFAGALGIKLGGTNIYFGKPVEKPTIGDADREISQEDILRAIRLMYAASFISLVIFTGAAAGIMIMTGTSL